MGREVRMVPADWQHPKEEVPHWRTGRMEERFTPLYESGWADRAKEWDAEREKWERGEFPDYAGTESKALPYDQWAGKRPYSGDYMPDWPAAQRTHLMMYENTSEGTPISPAFATPEELARWLADNGASAFGSDTADYEHWLRVAKGGYAPSMVLADGKLTSGVQAF